MKRKTYAESLAKDRDKYRVERNILAMHLEALIGMADHIENDWLFLSELRKARKALDKIYPKDKV